MTKVAKSSNRGAKSGERRGGRTKGTPNKATQAVKDKLDSMDCDPIKGMAKIAKQAMDDDNYMLAGTMYKELARYYAPTMKSIEMEASVGLYEDAKALTREQLLERIKDKGIDPASIDRL